MIVSIRYVSLIYEWGNLALLPVSFCARGFAGLGQPGVDCNLEARLANPGVPLYTG